MPRVVDHEQRRTHLALACFDLFASAGYAQATVKDMARAAGVSAGTFYHYFPDKRAVLEHMFAIVTSRDVASAMAVLPGSGATGEERLAAVQAFLTRHRPHLIQVLQVAMEVFRSDPDGREQLAASIETYRLLLGTALGIDDGPMLRIGFSWVLGELIQSQWEEQGQPVSDLVAVWTALQTRGVVS